MGKIQEDSNGLCWGFLKTVQHNSFSKLISVVCNFNYAAQHARQTLFSSRSFGLCCLKVISELYSKKGQVKGKMTQNELHCCDTAVSSLFYN